jgi:hypothetical protein
MFRCIQGKVVGISVKEGGSVNHYRRNWQSLTPAEFECPCPHQIARMIYLSEKLSADFEFVRIDLYLAKGGDIYFSEYTFTPYAGGQIFPDALELELGKAWG